MTGAHPVTVAPLVYYIIQRCMAHACNLVENNRLNLFVLECIFSYFPAEHAESH